MVEEFGRPRSDAKRFRAELSEHVALQTPRASSVMAGSGHTPAPRANNNKVNFDAVSRKLLSASLADGLQCASDLRERIEIVHSSDYANFLRTLFPVFRELLLHRLECEHGPDTIENRFRHTILEVLNRLPNNEVLRPYTRDLLRVATETLGRDNEENALTCLRIIFDLHKNYRPALEGEVQTFLDLVQKIYSSLPEAMDQAFRMASNAALPDTNHGSKVQSYWDQNHIMAGLLGESRVCSHESVPVVIADKQVPTKMRERCTVLDKTAMEIVNDGDASLGLGCLRGTASFKVLTECPLIVMLLFQLYPKFIQENIPRLTPLMMKGLALRAPSIAKYRPERYTEFVACQVKTLSFLTYLLRGFSDLMKPYEDAISRAVLALLISCPGEAVCTRKELLVATRHILATDFRGAFFKHIDVLLDENTLVGCGRQNRDTLRPLAYSTLADLVHHIRPRLNLEQLTRVVVVFARNLQDNTLPLSIHSTSVRLLLNLVDYIFHSVESNAAQGKQLLVWIMRTLVDKLVKLHGLLREGRVTRQYNKAAISACTTCEAKLVSSSVLAANSNGMSARLGLLERLPTSVQVASSQLLMCTCCGENGENAKDIRSLLQTVFRGLKTVIWCVAHHCNDCTTVSAPQWFSGKPSESAVSSDALEHRSSVEPEARMATRTEPPKSVRLRLSRMLSSDDAGTVADFFSVGIRCCQECVRDHSHEAELKEILDNFAGAFTVLDDFNLRNTIGRHIPLFYEALLAAPQLIAVAQLMLANTNVSATFADMLLNFLPSKFHALAQIQPPVRTGGDLALLEGPQGLPSSANRASLVLKLYKIAFGSIALFSGNKAVLQARLHDIVISCMRFGVAVGKPAGYFLLLRTLFRSFGNTCLGELERSRSGTDRTWQNILNVVLQLRSTSIYSPFSHHVLTEVALTLPVHYSSLNVTTRKLLPVLVSALGARNDLTSAALRAVERHIDALGAKCLLDASLACDVAVALVVRILKHLRPSPYPYGTVALRILGKIGGQTVDAVLSRAVAIPTKFPDSSAAARISALPHSAGFAASVSKAAKPSRDVLCQLSFHLKFILHWTHPHQSLVQGQESQETSAAGFQFDATKCTVAVCELFHSLLRVPHQASQRTSFNSQAAKVSSEGIAGPIARRLRCLCFRFVVTAVSSLLCTDHVATGAIKTEPGAYDSMPADAGLRGQSVAGVSMTWPNAMLQSLLSVLLASLTLQELSSEAGDVISCICRCAAALERRRAVLLKLCSSSIDGHPAPRVDSVDSTLSSSLICALMDALSSSSQQLQEAAVGCLTTLVINANIVQHETTVHISENAVADEVVSQLGSRFRDSYPSVKDGLCLALISIIPISSRFWTDAIQSQLLRSLLVALRIACYTTSLREMQKLTATTCTFVRLTPAHSGISHEVILSGLANRHCAVRLCCQCALMELKIATNLSCSSPTLSARMKLEKTNVIGQCLESDCPSDSYIGSLDALLFLMSSDPPNVPFDDELQRELCGIINRCRQSKNDAFRGRTYPQWISLTAWISAMSSKRSPSFCVALNIYGLWLALQVESFPAWTIIQCSVLRIRVAGVRQVSRLRHTMVVPSISNACFSLMIEFALESAEHDEPFVCCTASILLQEISTLCGDMYHKAMDEIFRSILSSIKKNILNLAKLKQLETMLSAPRVRRQCAGEVIHVLVDALRAWHSTFSGDVDVQVSIHTGVYLVRLLGIASLADGNRCVRQSTSCRADDMDTICATLVGIICQVEAQLPLMVRHRSSSNAICKSDASCFVMPDGSDKCDGSCTTEIVLGQCTCLVPSSPFRVPLAVFVSRNSKASAHFFMHPDSLADPILVALVRSLIKLPQAGCFRSYLLSTDGANLLMLDKCGGTGKLVLSETNGAPNHDTHVQGWRETRRVCEDPVVAYHRVQILHTLLQLDSQFIQRNPHLTACLRSIWRRRISCMQVGRCTSSGHQSYRDSNMILGSVPNSSSFETVTRTQDELKLVAECLMSYSRNKPIDVALTFELLGAVMPPSPLDAAAFMTFYLKAARRWSFEVRTEIFVTFLQMLTDNSFPSELKVLALRFIVIPLTASAKPKNRTTDVPRENTKNPLPIPIITLFVRTGLDMTGKLKSYPSSLRMQLLKLTTLLIEQYEHDLVEHRKELIKFAWNHLKSEDSSCRQWAYVNVCKFIATYETPPKIILQVSDLTQCVRAGSCVCVQVYVALLRTFQPEARELVRLALDVLVPALPIRLPLPDFVKAIKWTKKITYEEGHALPQILHIWQLVVRHPSLFFEYRAQFLPQMINSLNRLGLPPNCPIENRDLAVNVADLIISWEMRGMVQASERSPSPPACTDRTKGVERSQSESTVVNVEVADLALSTMWPCHEAKPSPTLLVAPESGMSPPMIEMLTNFLVRLALFSSDNKEPIVQRLAALCIRLFRVALHLWPHAHVRFSYFEKLIASSLPQKEQVQVRHKGASQLGGSNSKIDFRGLYSPSLLATCLDILIATLEVGAKPNPFLFDNIRKAQQLIFPCFEMANDSIHKKLHRLFERIVSLYPPAHLQASSSVQSLYYGLHSWLEQTIRWAAGYQVWRNMVVGGRSEQFEASPSSLEGVRPDEMQTKHDGSSYFKYGLSTGVLLSALSSLTLVCNCSSGFVITHVNSLLQLAFTLARVHLAIDGSNSTAELRKRSHRLGSNVQAPVAAAPIMSMLSDSLDAARRAPSRCHPTACGSTAALAKCLKILAQASELRSLPSLRRPLVALLFGCVERSGSVVLLQTLYSIVEAWSVGWHALLTRNEKIALLQSMSNIDRLPEIESMPLVSSFLNISRRLSCYCSRQVQTSMGSRSGLVVNPVMLYAPGLMCLHAGTRSEFRAKLLRGMNQDGDLSLGLMLSADWSPASQRFWLLVVVEFLLDSIANDKPITVRGCSQWLIVDASLHEITSHSAHMSQSTGQDLTSPLTWYCRSNSCITLPLKEIAHAHIALAQFIIQSLLPALSASDQVVHGLRKQLAADYHLAQVHVPRALSEESMREGGVAEVPYLDAPQMLVRVEAFELATTFQRKLQDSVLMTGKACFPRNVPCALLAASRVAKLRLGLTPQQFLNVMLKYNCRHEVLHIFENTSAPEDALVPTRFDIDVDHSLRPYTTSYCVLEELAAIDERAGVFDAVLKSDQALLATQQYYFGRISEAQKALFAVISESSATKHHGFNVNSVGDGPGSAHGTLFHRSLQVIIAQNQWIQCARDLSQWRLLRDVTKQHFSTTGRCLTLSPEQAENLRLEASWKLQDWDSVRRFLDTTSRSEFADAESKLHEIRLAVLDHRYADVDLLCAECANLALQRWCLLPVVTGAGTVHKSMLHMFHQLVEVHESAHLLRTAGNVADAVGIPDTRVIARAWRRRLPPTYMSVATWEDILRWREFCFGAMADFHDPNLANGSAAHEELWWTKAKLLQSVRRHGLVATSEASSLTQTQLSNDSSPCSFYVMREQLLSYSMLWKMSRETDIRLREFILQRMERMHFACLSGGQQAELFRLKGIIHGAFCQYTEAHRAFSRALVLRCSYGRAWFAWGTLCESQMKSGSCRETGEESCVASSAVDSCGRYAVACFLNAIQFEYVQALPGCVSRVLWILHTCNYTDSIASVFSPKASILPTWIWIPWIYSLLAVSDIQATIMLCLMRIGTKYPQALLYIVRAYLQAASELRSNADNLCQCEQTSSDIARQTWHEIICKRELHCHLLICSVRVLHSHLAHAVDILCADVASTLNVSGHERLNSANFRIVEIASDSPVRSEKTLQSATTRLLSSAISLLQPGAFRVFRNALNSVIRHVKLSHSSITRFG